MECLSDATFPPCGLRSLNHLSHNLPCSVLEKTPLKKDWVDSPTWMLRLQILMQNIKQENIIRIKNTPNQETRTPLKKRWQKLQQVSHGS